LSPGDNADREGRNVEGFHVGRDIILKAWDESLDLLFDRRFRRCRRSCGSPMNRHGKCDRSGEQG